MKQKVSRKVKDRNRLLFAVGDELVMVVPSCSGSCEEPHHLHDDPQLGVVRETRPHPETILVQQPGTVLLLRYKLTFQRPLG
jgi:hypothetical protein